MAAKHFGSDPYELWHVGHPELPPHPRPGDYRSLMFAMALWCEDRDLARLQALPDIFAAKLLGGMGKKGKKQRGRRG